MNQSRKIIVGLSGGLDSTMTAYLLSKIPNTKVVGVHLRTWDLADEMGQDPCPNSLQDWTDVQSHCKLLNIECMQLNYTKSYWSRVFDPFLTRLASGETPNPDVGCNKEIKFGVFMEYALEVLKADFVATGHYARVDMNGQLLRGIFF